MSQNLEALFSDDAPQSGPIHEFFTDEPDPIEEAVEEAHAFAEYVGEDPEALHDSWAKALSKHVPLILGLSSDRAKDWWISRGHPVGYVGESVSYPKGLWKIQFEGARVRFLDVEQLEALYGAWRRGDDELVKAIVEARAEERGPVREGKPPIDAFGRELEEIPDRGDHGPLKEECEWIEAHDEVFIRYAGEDAVWPEGCWEVNKPGCDRQLLDANQVKYVAHEILGMPETVKRRARKAALTGDTVVTDVVLLGHNNGEEDTDLEGLFADDNEDTASVPPLLRPEVALNLPVNSDGYIDVSALAFPPEYSAHTTQADWLARQHDVKDAREFRELCNTYYEMLAQPVRDELELASLFA